ncbi:MAG: archaeal proteasome endopeptidase complex subunit alpha [bacterium]|jgi:20S proteasome subunit alpha 5
MFEKNEYDRSVSTFSSQGRLFQIEYAMKAVEQGATTLGIQVKDGVILAAEKKVKSKLQIPSSLEKISKISNSVMCGYSGLLSDGRSLVDHARVEATNHWFVYNEEMPLESLALSICELALSFADKDKKKKDDEEEKRKISRPFGCALLIAGLDRNKEPVLFRNDPSGNYCRFRACCIGAGSENGMMTLSELYKEEMNLEDAIKLAGKVIKENMEQKINKDNIEISYISVKDGKIVNLSTNEIEALLPQLH